MQVKDYLQALQDENQIKVEKIGSGNWYWAFPGEDVRAKQDALEKATQEREKLQAAVADVQLKLQEATAARAEDADGARQEALRYHGQLLKDVEALRTELTQYADADPAVAERRKADVETVKQAADRYSDQILEMEQYFKDELQLDAERLSLLKLELYDDEYDVEDEGLGDMVEPIS